MASNNFIEKVCPTCGRKTRYSLMNVKEIKYAKEHSLEVPAKVYRCNFCGHQVVYNR